MNRFFITGLPRSRTAWLAALFNQPEIGVSCIHELLPQSKQIVDMPRVWEKQLKGHSLTHAGMSSPGLYVYHRELTQWYPEAQWLIVERDPEDVYASTKKLGLSWGGMREQLHISHRHLFSTFGRVKGLMVRYEGLSDPEVIRCIWHRLVPGAPFDAERALALQGQKIVNAESVQNARLLLKSYR